MTPEGDPGATFVKNVESSALLRGSLRGPWETEVRIAFTLKRFGVRRTNNEKAYVFKLVGHPQGVTTTNNPLWAHTFEKNNASLGKTRGEVKLAQQYLLREQ